MHFALFMKKKTSMKVFCAMFINTSLLAYCLYLAFNYNPISFIKYKILGQQRSVVQLSNVDQ